MQLRFRISYIICFAFALLAFAGFSAKQSDLLPNAQQVVAPWQETGKIEASEKGVSKAEISNSAPSETVHLQPQFRVQTAARVKDAAKTFLLSRYLSYLDDSFSLHATTTFTDAVAFHITAYRFLLTFPKHWFW
ncbi:hypothetical protein [Polluticoccus soli]|uniref:hypothetical protein n=1 Tax=Polluticoccus soli TaxID=3034150 RepID=UPI0023E11863|nr:hypothetical protein [Flavipsychrobacter sp. JY13-12]